MATRTLTNPILPGWHADPSICRVGDRYVIATSTCEYFPAIALNESSDLQTWRSIGHAIDRPEQLDLSRAVDSAGVWAATIRYHRRRWYLVATVHDSDPARARSFVLTASDPGGSWSDPHWVDDAVGIDPSLFFHRGRAWWTGTRAAPNPEWPAQSELWLREFDPVAMKLIGPERVIGTGAVRGARWIEGPHLYDHDGGLLLIAAEGGTGRDHAVVAARAQSIDGPFEWSYRNPILTHRHLGSSHPVQNVGHADLVTDPHGASWAVVLGSRLVDGQSLLGRETFLAPVAWEDGWPVIAPGTGALSGTPAPRPVDESVPAVLTGWSSVRGPAPARQTPSGVQVWPRSDHEPGLLLRPITSENWSMEIQLQLPDASIGGAVLRADSSHHVMVIARRDGDRVFVELRDGRGPSGGVWLHRPSGEVAIQIELDGLDLRCLVEDTWRAEADARQLSTETVGGFTGTMAGVTALSGQLTLLSWSIHDRTGAAAATSESGVRTAAA